MTKPLTQITFEFAPAEEHGNQPDSEILAAEIKAEYKPATKTEAVTIAKEVKTVKGKRGRKSLKEIDEKADLLQVPGDEELFKKQYYSIGEVSAMFRENQSLIRFWETEFDILQPRKNRKGDRFFRPVDIKNLVMIYDLLRRRKFTIEGAKDYLKKNKKVEERFAAIQSLQKIKNFLLEIKASL